MPLENATFVGRWIGRLKPAQALALGLSILLTAALLDFWSGTEISLGFFYVVPVLLVGWRGTLRSAIFVSFLSAALWEGVMVLNGEHYSNWWLYIWNPGNRFLSHCISSFLLNRLRLSMEKLERMSRTDSLTGLKNRGAFLEKLQDELNRQHRTRRSLSLAYVDLDHFKEVNDSQGHMAGDRALRAVARVLRTRMRKTDVVGRLGGDEFAILMPETNGEGAVTALRSLRRKLIDSMQRHNLPITFSMGVVTCRGESSPTYLLQQADTLMYSVKRDGRNDIRHSDLTLP